MAKMSTGAAIVESLIANGVDTIFGLPGAQTYALFDALQKARDRIRLVSVRHEQAAAYMAFGYARSTGRVGAYSVVPGPGVLNTMAALSTAVGCNVPVLCITGQVPADFLGKGRGHLHELPDQLGTLQSLVKWAARITQPGEAPELVAEAFRRMLTGRPGPAVLETPWDVMGEVGEVRIAPVTLPDPPAPDAAEIAAAAELICAAENPMIYTGGGALDASGEVTQLAERLWAPVFSFRSGRGVVSDDHPLGFSLPAAHELWDACDLLIGIGTRLEGPYMRWNQIRWMDKPADPKLIRIDIDPKEMTRFAPDAGVLGDARVSAQALNEALEARQVQGRDRSQQLAAIKTKTLAAFEDIQPQMSYLKVIRQALPDDGFFVEELCQAGFASNYAFPVLAPRSYVTCGYQGTLGFGFQTGLGVKIANPERAVVSITGDGGFMFGLQELATAAQHEIGLITILFNNGGFENVRRDQDNLFDGRAIGSTWTNPDFMTLAQAFGVRGLSTDSPEGLGAALTEALAADGPTLIEVRVESGREVTPWPLIHPAPLNP